MCFFFHCLLTSFAWFFPEGGQERTLGTRLARHLSKQGRDRRKGGTGVACSRHSACGNGAKTSDLEKKQNKKAKGRSFFSRHPPLLTVITQKNSNKQTNKQNKTKNRKLLFLLRIKILSCES